MRINPPRRTWIDLVIATGTKQRGPSLPSKRPFGSIYQAGKKTLQFYGYYDKYKLERYDPEHYYDEYIGKYTYKPRKRLAGYVGQKLHAKKSRSGTKNKVYQKSSKLDTGYWHWHKRAKYSYSKG